MARLAARLVLALLLSVAACTGARPPSAPHEPAGADPELLAAIEKIPAIDHHAHPQKLLGPGEKDQDWDQLTYEGFDEFRLPQRFGDETEWLRATRGVYPNYPFDDVADSRDPWIADARGANLRAHGDAYPAWILDRLGIETMLANRVQPGARGLAAPRFRWVPYDDALIFPLDLAGLKKQSRDAATFFPGIATGAKRVLADAGLETLPRGFDDYRKVVTATLERQQAAGAVAIKFECAYLRPLEFGDPPEADARRVYEACAAGGTPPDADYRLLQDYLMRYVAREAGRLGLPVHFHVAFGPGRWFRSASTTPYALESLFDDPTLATTKFVIVHGGWPEVHQTTALLAKPNVWADFSWQTQIVYPRALAATLREWLETWPDKILFGTDAFGDSWEIVAWKATSTGRLALAMALTDMMHDGEITRARALELAHMVLHDNAARLYGWMK